MEDKMEKVFIDFKKLMPGIKSPWKPNYFWVRLLQIGLISQQRIVDISQNKFSFELYSKKCHIFIQQNLFYFIFPIVFKSVHKITIKGIVNGRKASHILLIFSSEPPRNFRSSNIILVRQDNTIF